MERRHFIKNSMIALFSAASITKTSLKASSVTDFGKNNNVLKGFIVSDAHFGWDHQQQPSAQLQAKMMQKILKRFPDLDVFFDTGDAHHSGLHGASGDLARGDWTDIIAGGCGTTPFYYTAGNHGIVAQMNDDSEWRCNKLGSISCRPYYSFDIKGIHFISLPELESSVFINKESLEWLSLDLEVNKDSTVIILSHNNIKGTTTPLGEPGYRGLVNSKELLEIFNRYPNIIAWMHGHNHTYEVVKQNKKLFVSNGRIGGFAPPAGWGKVGQEHLGGIYFEVKPDRLIVRSYSATENNFLDELGDPHLSNALMTKTTVDPNASSAYSYGVGGMCNGQKIPVFHHHTTTGMSSELFVTGAKTPAINDDPAFLYHEFRDAGKHGKRWMLMGASVGYPAYFENENKDWQWQNPGIRLLPQESSSKTVDVCVPEHLFGKNAYYRCATDQKYKAVLEIDSPQGGQKLQLLFICYDKEGNELANIKGDPMILRQGQHIYEAEFEIPCLSQYKTIYTDSSSNNMTQVMTKARFSQLKHDVLLRNFAFMFSGAGTKTIDPTIIIDGKHYAHSGTVSSGEVVRFSMATPSLQRSLYECKVKGNHRATWLVRHKSLDWQVRNAPVTDKGDYFEVGPLRNTWTHRKEIVLTPMTRVNKPYVHRLQNIQKARIYPLNRNNKILKIDILESSVSGKILVQSEKKPTHVLGAKKWEYNSPHLSIEVEQGFSIKIL